LAGDVAGGVAAIAKLTFNFCPYQLPMLAQQLPVTEASADLLTLWRVCCHVAEMLSDV